MNSGQPAVSASVVDEEATVGSPPPPTDPPDPDPPPPPPPPGGDPGGGVLGEPNWDSVYSGNTPPSWPLEGNGHGTRFQWTNGTHTNREPTPGNQGRMNFLRSGASMQWLAGRVDAVDAKKYPRPDGTMILTGAGLNSGPFDPAVFPGTAGPHRHSMTSQNKSFWTRENMLGYGTPRDDGEIELAKAFIRTIMTTSDNGFGARPGMMPYWPTFLKDVSSNERRHSGYIGRPRQVPGPPRSAYFRGNTVPWPQGLRLATFQCGFFKPGGSGDWEFTAQWPMCWNGTDLWLRGGAHMAFLRSDGTPPPSHPFVLPMVHWFASISGTSGMSKSQMENLQSSQVTDNNPAAQYYGQRRDFWNYNNRFVPTHAELILALDPVASEAISWMVNNYKNAGRIGRSGAV